MIARPLESGASYNPTPAQGGSANAYAYGDPLTETDPTGEWSLNQTSGGETAIGEGPAINLENGIGIAAGAISPPPPNIQAEQAYEADPPWDTYIAGETPAIESRVHDRRSDYLR